MERIKVVQFGLGPIGKSSLALALEKPRLELVGAIDIDPALVGKDLGTVLGRDRVGVAVTDDADSALELARGGCAIHTTSSSAEAVAGQLERAAACGVNVVSSTEELLYPLPRTRAVFERLDEAFAKAGVSLLGTGVNPGFVMDSLPSFVSAVCHEVKAVRVLRIVDAAKRRGPLQKKVGAGLTVEEFERLKKEGRMGHVGLLQSLHFLADSLGLSLERAEESLEPVVAEREIETEFVRVAPGHVAGIKNVGRGFRGGKEVVTLDLRMYVGAEDPRDEVRIDGRPPMNVVIQGGTSGDLATGAMLVNAVPAVVAAPPGLRTMREVSLVHFLKGADKMAEEVEVGKVFTYFRKVGVAALKLTSEVKKGDTLHFKGKTTDFSCVAESMQVENEEVDSAGPGADLGIKITERVRDGDVVYKVTE